MAPRQRAKNARTPLSADERDGIVLAVNSAFRKLKNIYDKILPIFDNYGFRPRSAGVVARDLSEKIEAEIVRHCASRSGEQIVFDRVVRPASNARQAVGTKPFAGVERPPEPKPKTNDVPLSLIVKVLDEL